MGFDMVIAGGGFGGLEAAFTIRTIIGDEARVTLIDRQGYDAMLEPMPPRKGL